jgi:hypothetical protein
LAGVCVVEVLVVLLVVLVSLPVCCCAWTTPAVVIKPTLSASRTANDK